MPWPGWMSKYTHSTKVESFFFLRAEEFASPYIHGISFVFLMAGSGDLFEEFAPMIPGISELGGEGGEIPKRQNSP